MSRSIRARLDRLEEPHNSPDADKLPPGFWGAICGTIPPEQVDPDTRRFLAPLFEDSRKEQDPNKQSEGAS